MHRKIVLTIFIIFLCTYELSIAKVINNNRTYENSSTEYEAVIEDDADLLTDSEEEKLLEEMKDLTDYGNIILKTINKNSYGTTAKYAERYYHDNYGKSSGTVFLIDMDERIIYIFSDGDNYRTIRKSKAEVITDNVYKYASKKEYYTCASEAFSQIKTLLDGGKIAEPMKYVSNAIIAIMLAFFTNFVIFKRITKTKAASNNEQIKECEFSVNYTKPEVVKTGQHSVYSPVSRDSGSSGGSSGGGGGGSSGGGGGHRF